MKLIDVLNKQCNGEIRKGTKLIIDFSYEQDYPETYTYNSERFINESHYEWIEGYGVNKGTLNQEVDVIPPKKYWIKFNMRGLRDGREYLNLDYDKRGYECVHPNSKYETSSIQTRFTKSELQSIKAVREFLEDMEGKYQLIEAK